MDCPDTLHALQAQALAGSTTPPWEWQVQLAERLALSCLTRLTIYLKLPNDIFLFNVGHSCVCVRGWGT